MTREAVIVRLRTMRLIARIIQWKSKRRARLMSTEYATAIRMAVPIALEMICSAFTKRFCAIGALRMTDIRYAIFHSICAMWVEGFIPR
jgi:hypothetical protein